MTELAVAWATDRRYAPHAAASIHSVLSSERRAVAHVLVSSDLGERALRRFGALGTQLDGRVHLHRVDETLVARLPTMADIPSVMWYRVHLPALLPGVDRALYLDADTIARTSIAPLFELDMGHSLIGAVDNVTEPGVRDFHAELQLPPAQRYFNSGVLLMDLSAMREAGATDAILEAARLDLVWPDQDALNVTLGGQRMPLHPRWNAQNSLFFWTDWAQEVFGAEAEEARSDPAILHFEGHGPGTKPWDDRCRHPHRRDYLRHARETPWPQAPDVARRSKRVWRRLSSRLSARARIGR